MAAIKEGLFEGYYGKKNISYSDQPMEARLMIKHSRDIAEGEARFRSIESLFVETADGSRYKLPHRNLMCGKVMARHCSEGGNPYDVFGQYINGMVTEMNTLGRFIRAARHKNLNDDAVGMLESAVRHYTDLKAKAKIEKLDEDLDDLETKHKVIEKEKIDEITGLKRQIDEMS
jgi:hypothetical protein